MENITNKLTGLGLAALVAGFFALPCLAESEAGLEAGLPIFATSAAPALPNPLMWGNNTWGQDARYFSLTGNPYVNPPVPAEGELSGSAISGAQRSPKLEIKTFHWRSSNSRVAHRGRLM